MPATVCHSHKCVHMVYTNSLCVAMKVSHCMTPGQPQTTGPTVHVHDKESPSRPADGLKHRQPNTGRSFNCHLDYLEVLNRCVQLNVELFVKSHNSNMTVKICSQPTLRERITICFMW